VEVQRYRLADDLPDEDAERLAAVCNAVEAGWVPGERPMSTAAYRDMERSMQHEPLVIRRRLARLEGRVVGQAESTWRDDAEEAGAAEALIMVDPTTWGRGVGRALWADMVAAARTDGRTGVLTYAALGSRADHLGRRHGLLPDLVLEQNRCAVATASDELLQAWVRRGEATAEYSLVAWDGRCPDDDLAAAFADVARVMNDAPRVQGEAEQQVTVRELRAVEAASVAAGQQRWVVTVRHDGSGRLVGMSELMLPGRRPWIALQGDTGVVAEHRGHGLGAWMKGVNHLRLRRERPEVEMVETWNAEVNEPMLRINRDLGFRPVQRYRGLLLPFADHPAPATPIGPATGPPP
jgi:GNAT superfamily N-acetyltransferase